MIILSSKTLEKNFRPFNNQVKAASWIPLRRRPVPFWMLGKTYSIMEKEMIKKSFVYFRMQYIGLEGVVNISYGL